MILKKVPLRKCIVCGIQKPKYEFLVVVKPPKNSNEKMKVIDGSTKKEGRGAYFCKNKECYSQLRKLRKLEKSFRQKIDEQIYDDIDKAVKAFE